MEVNNTIYPVIDSSSDFDFTKNVGDYSINTKLDESIVYSSSSSQWADLKHNVIYSWYYTNVGKYKIVADNMSADYQRKILAIQNTRGIFSYSNSNDNFEQLQNFKFGYDAETINNYYNYNQLIRGFKYFSLCGCIYIEHYANAGFNTTRVDDMKTYFDTYSGNKIKRVILTLYNGTNSARTSKSIQFINYIDYSIPFFTIPNMRDETTYTLDYTTIINYFPFYSSATNNTIGTTVFGMAQASGSYQTTAVLNTVKGNNFFRANVGGINWDNVNDISYSQTNVATFQPSIEIDRNNILHMCATYGVMFTDDETIAKTLDLTIESNLSNEHLYLPVIESNKLWQGNFTSGAGNLNNPVKEWNSDKNAPFVNGSPSIENINPSIYSNGETLGLITPAAAFTNMYLITAANLKNLVDWLNPADDDIFEGRLDGLKFSGANPLNSITNIMQFPVNVPHSANAENVVIGKLTSPVLANKITTSTFEISGGTTKPIYAFYKNWLDYEPYTQYVAWVPYCGWIELSANVITGNSLTFKYEIDVISGACTCRILVNGVQYKTINGNIATQFAIQAEDTKGYTQSVLNSVGKIGTGFAGVFAGAAVTETGVGAVAGIPLMMGSFGNAVSGFWDFVCPQENFTTVGTMTGNVSCFCPRKVNIYRFYTPVKPDNDYGKFIGYACEFSETLSNLSGFCMVSNANTDRIVATETELKEIINILESGFYI